MFERQWLEYFVILNKRNPGGTIMQTVVRHVERRILDLLPCSRNTGLLQIVLQCKVQFEIQCVAVTTDASRVGVVDGLLHIRQKHGRIGIEYFGVGKDIALASVEKSSWILAV